MEKKCSKCQAVKDVREFYRDKAKKDGLQCSCKICQKIVRKQHYQEHREQILPQRKRYYKEHRAERLAYYQRIKGLRLVV